MGPTFLILGGYGNAGSRIADLLLTETDCSLILSGRDLNRAIQLTDFLNRKFEGARVSCLQLDAANKTQLTASFRNIDLVIVASSTVEYVENVAHAAIVNKVDYLDIQFSNNKIRILKSLEEKIRVAGLRFITDGGYHPGIPAILVRYAAMQMNSIREAVVGAIMNINWKSYQFSEETIREFINELKGGSPMICKNGCWGKARWGGMFETYRMDFGGNYGQHELFPMFLEEMRNLPSQYNTLKKTGFYIGGMDWFSNWISFPLASMWFQVFPGIRSPWIEKLIFWGMKKFVTPPWYTRIKLISTGIKKEEPIQYSLVLSHPDAYMFTAIPVVACLLQYIHGKLIKPGLYTQGEIVDPLFFLKNANRMGIEVEEIWNNSCLHSK